ncbi:MAG: FAD-dependent oxidoreductase [Candidatus Saccharimonadaceae bacterium]
MQVSFFKSLIALTITLIVTSLVSASFASRIQNINYSGTAQLVIIGGGASGVSAGVHAARMGVSTIIVEETSWLGGMLTSAGVSAIDGNNMLPSGFWGEFRDSLINHYGSREALNTGWVSKILFEPSVGNEIFKYITQNEKNLKIYTQSSVKKIVRQKNNWAISINTPTGEKMFYPQIVIDGTELGDIAKLTGVKYDVGMENRKLTGEDIAPEEANNIIQDLTYVALLKDYGKDVTIPKPLGYDVSKFACACKNPLCISPKEENRVWSAEEMINYGKLPNNKYMINWPIEGNDYYLNLIDKNSEERKEAIKEAKNFTLQFVYFIQTELGMNTLSLADDEFPTDDNLPLIPYHRESRRIHGLTRFTLPHITDPFTQEEKLYRTAIAVGDYPVDHHHARYHDWEQLPNLYFHPVPSYGLPLGTLIPKEVKGLIVTEKSISVSNIVNGTTRLQPVVLQIGQVAGTLAALAIIQKKDVADVKVRDVQKQLLQAGGYLLPYLDVEKTHPLFGALQRIGVTGILQGIGKNEGWANQTWFRINDPLYYSELEGLKDIYPTIKLSENKNAITIGDAIEIINEIAKKEKIELNIHIQEWAKDNFKDYDFEPFDLIRNIKRGEMALLIDKALNPFTEKEIDIHGFYVNTKKQ